jgi:hypothetical protein
MTLLPADCSEVLHNAVGHRIRCRTWRGQAKVNLRLPARTRHSRRQSAGLGPTRRRNTLVKCD